MISVDYRLAGRALMKTLRSFILRALTWPSRVSPQPAAALPETARPERPRQPPAVASATEDDQTQAAAHLEYLGYEVGLDPDGWSHARHPFRFNFHLRTFACGTRLHCEVGIGASIGNSRAAWIDFLNKANDRGHVTRFSLVEYSEGLYRVRMRALITGAYNQSIFAMVMDMWHEDLDLVRRKPEFLPETTVGAREDAAAVTVN
jgi:hypothetical protein